MIEVLKQALTDAKRNERHNNVAETRYWLNQYKLIAEQAIAQHPPQRTEPKVCCQQYDTCLEPCTPRGRHLAQRTWVDLTRTQMQDVYFAVLEEHRGGHQMEGQLAFGEALQARLKERNT